MFLRAGSCASYCRNSCGGRLLLQSVVLQPNTGLEGGNGFSTGTYTFTFKLEHDQKVWSPESLYFVCKGFEKRHSPALRCTFSQIFRAESSRQKQINYMPQSATTQLPWERSTDLQFKWVFASQKDGVLLGYTFNMWSVGVQPPGTPQSGCAVRPPYSSTWPPAVQGNCTTAPVKWIWLRKCSLHSRGAEIATVEG